MIQKIINIKNIGKFKDCNPHGAILWSQTTAIYADNGSGKTTFTQLLKSLRGGIDQDRLVNRKTFGTNAQTRMQASILTTDNGVYKLNTRWDKNIDDIVAFDSFYIEDNVYVISLGNSVAGEPGTFAEIVLGKDLRAMIEQLAVIRNKIAQLKSSIDRLNTKAQKNKFEGINDPILERKLQAKRQNKAELEEEFNALDRTINTKAEEFGVPYVETINKYLKRFGTNIQISNLNKKDSHFIYSVKINDIKVRGSKNSISLKRTLSEGEKNCLAFAFFLARLDLSQNIKDQIVVFDDPISSLDSRRRSITLTILSSLASRVKQLVILSHDIHFIKDYCDRNTTTKTLCIKETGNGSIIEEFDTKESNRTGIFLDVEKIRDFSIDGSSAGLDPRDVIRCIRPTLEGLLRIKFIGLLNDKEWLGNFLNKIREADNNSPFYRYKDIIIDIEDLNDYTKAYHHSNPTLIEAQINENELKQKCKDTLDLILKI